MALTIPNTFTALGTILSAQVNANFTAIANHVNGNLDQTSLTNLTGVVTWAVSTNVLAQNITSSSTAGVIAVNSSGVLASTKSALSVISNAVQNAGDALVKVDMQNSSSTIPSALIENAGTGSGLKVVNTGSGAGIEVTNGTDPLLKASNNGVVLVTMDTADRDAIVSPVAGQMIFNSETKRLETYSGSRWRAVGKSPGIIDAFGGEFGTQPEGAMMCDGSSLLRADYPELFAVIGTAFGAADGTHFNIPDLAGQFLRGVDNGTGTDPNAATRTASATGGNTGDAVGTRQADATAKNGLTATDSGHNHVQSYVTGTGSFANVQGFSGVGNNTGAAQAAGTASSNVGANATATGTASITIGAGDSETRPLNTSVEFIIWL